MRSLRAVKVPPSVATANVVACSSQAYQAGVPIAIVSASPAPLTRVLPSTSGVVRAITVPFHAAGRRIGNLSYSTAESVTLQVPPSTPPRLTPAGDVACGIERYGFCPRRSAAVECRRSSGLAMTPLRCTFGIVQQPRNHLAHSDED